MNIKCEDALGCFVVAPLAFGPYCDINTEINKQLN